MREGANSETHTWEEGTQKSLKLINCPGWLDLETELDGLSVLKIPRGCMRFLGSPLPLGYRCSLGVSKN